MIKRIELIIQTQNLTSSQFADKIGVQRSGLSHILAGRNKPSLDFVMKVLAAFPNIDPNWLLHGKGKMYVNLAEAPAPESQTLFSEEKTFSEEIPVREAFDFEALGARVSEMSAVGTSSAPGSPATQMPAVGTSPAPGTVSVASPAPGTSPAVGSPATPSPAPAVGTSPAPGSPATQTPAVGTSPAPGTVSAASPAVGTAPTSGGAAPTAAVGTPSPAPAGSVPTEASALKIPLGIPAPKQDDKRISQIILFYSDGTFQVFNPLLSV